LCLQGIKQREKTIEGAARLVWDNDRVFDAPPFLFVGFGTWEGKHVLEKRGVFFEVVFMDFV
jgi:hypothetical protein